AIRVTRPGPTDYTGWPQPAPPHPPAEPTSPFPLVAPIPGCQRHQSLPPALLGTSLPVAQWESLPSVRGAQRGREIVESPKYLCAFLENAPTAGGPIHGSAGATQLPLYPRR